MLRISLQTLRARRGTLAGAFVAIWLAVTLASATGLLMAGALGPPGAGRLAAADAVVRADPTVTIGHGEDAESLDVIPGPRLPAATVERVAAVPGVARAVGDIAFPAGAWDSRGRQLEGASRLIGHGWDSAALTPYHLTTGRPPAGPRGVVAGGRLPAPRPPGRRPPPPPARATSSPTCGSARPSAPCSASSAPPGMRATESAVSP